MTNRSLLVALGVLAASVTYGQTQLDLGNHAAITQSRLKAHMGFIAHDLLEGRDTPSRGLDIAAEYIAAQMKLFGLVPGGPKGSYFQQFPVKQARISSNSFLQVGNTRFAAFEGMIPTFSSGNASGSAVFIGHGFRIPSKDVDPYKDLDVRGKFVIRINEVPKDWNWSDYFAGKLPGAESPDQAARLRGAVGMLVIPSANEFEAWKVQANRAQAMTVPMSGNEFITHDFPSATLSLAATKVILGERFDNIMATKASASFAFDDSIKVTVQNEIVEETVMTRNVIAILPGSDPKLKSEYVAIGSHYDHVGVAASGTDQIFNGADDDGSGTVAMIEIAHALSRGKTSKRSILFIWHAGEEKGLWGSEYFTSHPTVPLKSIIAQLNIDMIGRSKAVGDKKPENKMLTASDSIYVIGSRRLSTELGDLCAKVNAQLFKLKLYYHYDRPNDPENLYERSDHYNYAKRGIPIAFYFDGVHEDYHQVSDHAERIDYRKLERVARTICATTWVLANRLKRPRIDKS